MARNGSGINGGKAVRDGLPLQDGSPMRDEHVAEIEATIWGFRRDVEAAKEYVSHVPEELE